MYPGGVQYSQIISQINKGYFFKAKKCELSTPPGLRCNLRVGIKKTTFFLEVCTVSVHCHSAHFLCCKLKCALSQCTLYRDLRRCIR